MNINKSAPAGNTNMKTAKTSWRIHPHMITRQFTTFLFDESSQAKAIRINIPAKLTRLNIKCPFFNE
jgi:hypothetical protein